MQKGRNTKVNPDLCSKKKWSPVTWIFKDICECNVINTVSRVGMEVAGHLVI